MSIHTQADILASTDATGSETLGGDWDLEYAIGKIEAESIFNTEIKNDYSSILVGNIPFTPLDAVNYLALDGFDVPRYSYTPIYIDITKGLPLTNIGNEAFSLKPNSTNLALLNNGSPYKFDKPRLNSLAFDFSTDSLNFNHHNFEFSSISPNENSITFGFETGKFDFSSFTSNNSLKFEFFKPGTYKSAIEKVDFNSMLSFDAKAVTFTSTSVTFDYLPKSVNFNSNLFKINSHLFDYKFLNNAEFSFTKANDVDFYKNFNASDYRALEYAFSGDELFDSNYYLAQGAIPKGMNPFTDYFENGYAAGKDPNPLFDTSYYNQNNPDVVAQGVEPMVHFSTTGYKENNLNRDPNALFDTSYYNEKNPDVVKYSINPLVHFSTTGYKENNLNRDPNALFDTSYYNEKNPDVVKYSINPLVHFSTTGYKENNLNRDPHPLFDTSYYNEKNPDVVKYSINPLVHFSTTGYKENNLNRDPNALFDTSYYNAKNLDVVRSGMNPLEHYIRYGFAENSLNRDPNALFDTSYYRANNPDVVKTGINPLEHYIRYGWRESLPNNPGGTNPNRDPNALFDTEFYFKIYDDVRLAALTDPSKNPLQHYLEFGQTDAIKRITHPIFQSENQLKFETVITSDSEGFAFFQNNISQYGLQAFPGDNGKILIAQSLEGGGYGQPSVIESVIYTIFAGAVFLIKERSLPGIIYNAIQDGDAFENFSITKGDIDFNPPPFPRQEEAPIIVESFPNGKQINDILNTDGSNIFTTPTTPILDNPNVVTFPQRDEILEDLTDGLFIFPGEVEIPQGFYTIDNNSNLNSVPIGSSSSLGIPEVESFVSGLTTERTPTFRKANLFEIEQTGELNYVVPTGSGRLNSQGKPESFKIDGYRGRIILDPKYTSNPDISPYILNSKAPQFIKDKTLTQERDQFRRAKDIIDNPSIPFKELEIVVNDSRLIPYFESLLQEFNIPGQVKVVPTQVK